MSKYSNELGICIFLIGHVYKRYNMFKENLEIRSDTWKMNTHPELTRQIKCIVGLRVKLSISVIRRIVG